MAGITLQLRYVLAHHLKDLVNFMAIPKILVMTALNGGGQGIGPKRHHALTSTIAHTRIIEACSTLTAPFGGIGLIGRPWS